MYNHDKIKDFDFHAHDNETVMQMMINMNPKKTTDCDNIPGKVIQIAHMGVPIAICSQLNASVRARNFLSIMINADVSSCFEKEDCLFKWKYKPASAFNVISKLYETDLNNQMVDHFRQLFNILLYTFRKHYYCQSPYWN